MVVFVLSRSTAREKWSDVLLVVQYNTLKTEKASLQVSARNNISSPHFLFGVANS